MEQSHILFATITGCVSNSAFARLYYPLCIMSTAV